MRWCSKLLSLAVSKELVTKYYVRLKCNFNFGAVLLTKKIPVPRPRLIKLPKDLIVER